MLKRKQSGQAVLMLIMIMAAIGSITLSVVSRSTGGLRDQQTDTASTRAFQAAESGLEKALLDRTDAEFDQGDVSFTAEYLESLGGGFVSARQIAEGEAIEIGLPQVGKPSAIKFYWSSPAALMIKVYDYDTVNYQVSFSTADANPGGRTPSSQFSLPNDSGGGYMGNNFDYGTVVNLTAESTLIRVNVLYGASLVAVEPSGGNLLTDQQVKIRSVGSEDNTNIKKGLELTKELDMIPEIYDNVLYTKGSLSQ
ncbi:hypothetical protein HY333_00675 [Candidatus Collierbacteria bacterium]|nr:hypothetical protein [Candidatus Collierbacteria bacterium]